MSEILKSFISSITSFSEKEIEEFTQKFKPISLKKNEHFIEQGEVCQKVGFVTKGIVRNYYLSSKEEEVTYCLTFPHHFVNAFSSYVSGQPTRESIHAITDVELLIFYRRDFEVFIQKDSRWQDFYTRLTEGAYIKLEEYIFMMNMESAEKRYEDLVKNYPDYIKHIPLKYLSSYLGITQRHLSRIRKNIF
ncbi:Crp/Fnr family transcriptional regulator [Flammeovirga sp. EKP202]|uniref:Crp/Fnr family transcriptional regulator n=1 Tax=Flammeovirga sp. EKP202 TaxID=2770592 RepID=UPI00165F337B|nr:Crp/Fnr family transcriptional regulator [Flammeovirga sp. EKP202]MBD0403807.1 Crp/Fnr family transcriptional regulator [Flammeovirga sp. EKP202]